MFGNGKESLFVEGVFLYLSQRWIYRLARCNV